MPAGCKVTLLHQLNNPRNSSEKCSDPILNGKESKFFKWLTILLYRIYVFYGYDLMRVKNKLRFNGIIYGKMHNLDAEN